MESGFIHPLLPRHIFRVKPRCYAQIIFLQVFFFVNEYKRHLLELKSSGVPIWHWNTLAWNLNLFRTGQWSTPKPWKNKNELTCRFCDFHRSIAHNFPKAVSPAHRIATTPWPSPYCFSFNLVTHNFINGYRFGYILVSIPRILSSCWRIRH